MISKLLSPTIRISIGLVGLTISLILSAYVLGLIPDERKVEINARGKIAEALAIQLSDAVSRNEARSTQHCLMRLAAMRRDLPNIRFPRLLSATAQYFLSP